MLVYPCAAVVAVVDALVAVVAVAVLLLLFLLQAEWESTPEIDQEL